MESYNFKLIVSNNHIESYDYKDTEIKTGFSRGGQGMLNRGHTKAGTRQIMEALGAEGYALYKKHEGRYLVHPEAEYTLFDPIIEKQEKKQKAKSSLSRTRNEMRRRINANPELLTFLTLTFRENLTDVKRANTLFNRFIVRLRKENKDFKYIAVIEFQKRGAVHYHLLCDLDISELDTKYKRRKYEKEFGENKWKHGFVKVKEADHVDNMGAYFCKYLSKDMFDEKMFRKKKYFCSQNLNKPIVLKGDKARFLLDKYLPETKLLFQKEMESQWVGRIEYKNYTVRDATSFSMDIAEINKVVPEKVDVLSPAFKF